MAISRDLQRKYPHMLPNDIEIWDTFLTQNPSIFDRFDYDVRVGEGYGISEDDPQWKQDLTAALTKFRIDVIGWSDGSPTIIEVKPYCGLSCLGQLLGYRFFWRKENPGAPAVNLLAVTDKTTPDIRLLFSSLNINVYEIWSPS